MEVPDGSDYQALTGFPSAKRPGFLPMFYTLANALELLGSPFCRGSDTETLTMIYATLATHGKRSTFSRTLVR